jgi:hypothetical protein
LTEQQEELRIKQDLEEKQIMEERHKFWEDRYLADLARRDPDIGSHPTVISLRIYAEGYEWLRQAQWHDKSSVEKEFT